MSESSPFLPHSDKSLVYENDYRPAQHKRSTFASIALSSTILAITVLSLIANAIQAWYLAQANQAAHKCAQPLTGLELNVDVDFGRRTSYGEVTDLAETDRLWYSMDTTMGVIALPKDLHLGSTYTFPWDLSKGVYVLNSYHSLHCLQAIYGVLRKYQQGDGDDKTFGHIVHCLDVIRSEVMCTADDTPLSFHFQKPNLTEWPPKRKCRDWNALADFATQNSACFTRFAPSDPRYSTIEEFTYCPNGSPYQSLVDEFKALNST